MTTLETDAVGEARRVAGRIEALPYIEASLRLPDLHMKDGMEAPSSFVTATKKTIIPQLVSESINDGMGLVATDLTVDDLSQDQILEIVKQVNVAGAISKAKPARYSWSRGLLEAACRGGAQPLLAHYGLPERYLSAFEDGGRAIDRELTAEEYISHVPRFLRNTKLTRSETGLNFAGNHFLEVQAVDEIVDDSVASRWGLRSGQVVVMYHLGPGPLGSILSNLHAYRLKPQAHRKAGYAFFRALWHGTSSARGRRDFAGFSNWLTIDADSEEGARYAMVLNIIKNYGFAYRTATVKAIVDAVNHVANQAANACELVVDLSHNMLQPEVIDGEEFWVSRHNCCRPQPGKPGILAGSHQVPSCLTVGPSTSSDTLAGFDHGVGFLIEQLQRSRKLGTHPSGHHIDRMVMTRGTGTVHEQRAFPLLDRTPLDDAIQDLSRRGMVAPVAMLRPLATLKHKL